MSAAQSAKRAATICKFWLNSHTCPKGDACRYRHDAAVKRDGGQLKVGARRQYLLPPARCPLAAGP